MTCPSCGGEDHEHTGWEPADPTVARDITAMLALVLSDVEDHATLQEFAILLGDVERAPSMLLRAIQMMALYVIEYAHVLGSPDPRRTALAAQRSALVLYNEILAEETTEETTEEDEEKPLFDQDEEEP